MTTPPPGDPFRYSVIAHGRRRILGPLSDERLDALVEALPLGRGDHALEIGSGKGELLVRLLARWPEATAEGFDRTPWFLEAARARAVEAGVERRVSFVETDTPGALIADRAAALTIAMGATGILGGQAETVAGLAAATRPGGTVVFGDGVWTAEPPAQGLAAFEMTRDELADGPDGFARLGTAHGLEVLGVEVVGLDEWDAYESSYATTVDDWAAAYPDDPDRAAFLERQTMMAGSYAGWRRGTMGFAIGRFRVPG